MKRTVLPRIVSILAILSLLLTALFQAVPVSAGEDSSPGSKISGFLELRVNLKLEAQQLQLQSQTDTGTSGENLTLPGGLSLLSEEDLASVDTEKVFLYFEEKPSIAQIDDLAELGIIAYPESWIPPLNDFPTGFVVAEMPVDQLNNLAGKSFIAAIDSAEERVMTQNDLARQAMKVETVWNSGNSGQGVTVAVVDSGIDATSPDFPTLNSSNSKDYSNYPTLDDTIANTVTGHGTHVAGSLLGRGVKSSTYKGVAPGANLVFLKVGTDGSTSGPGSAIVGAIQAAVDIYHVDIINISMGSWSEFHDGTSALCQAVDYAVSQGVAVFVASGNQADYGWHYSGSVAANSATDYIRINVSSSSGHTVLAYNLVWFDGTALSNHLALKYYDSAKNEYSVTSFTQTQSTRGTENMLSYSNADVGIGSYYLKVQNTSAQTQKFHLYFIGDPDGDLAFNSPDVNYTLCSPAEADSAIAVGAYITRANWTDFLGYKMYYPNISAGVIAPFSSRGPRVDNENIQKPEIVAPGMGIISVRDKDAYPWPSYNSKADIYPYSHLIIDNDGFNQFGGGPADYLLLQGTSMACPLAAGVGALVLSANPDLTPAELEQTLEDNAIDKGSSGFDNAYGWGLIDASAAAVSLPDAPSDLTATPLNDKQIKLEWTDNADDETGFKIERRLSSSASFSQVGTVGANVNSYISSGLTANTAYDFRVRAYRGAKVNSAYSNIVTAVTFNVPPKAPVLVSPKASEIVSSLTPTLQWQASSGAVSYALQVSASSDFSTLLVDESGLTDLTYTLPDIPLSWNSTYNWKVSATNAEGSTSAFSTARKFKTASGPPPQAPSDLITTPINDKQIKLQWTDNSEDETGFKIERKLSSATAFKQVGTVAAGVTTYTSTGMVAQTAYDFRVRANNGSKLNSEYSGIVTQSTLSTPPKAPVLVAPKASEVVASLTPTLEWKASSGAVSYTLQVSENSTFSTLLVDASGLTELTYNLPDIPLNWNSTYNWKVSATNAEGSTSVFSSARKFKTASGPPPEAPSDLVATPLSDKLVKLEWTDNSEDETGFKIERKLSSGTVFKQVGTVAAGVTTYTSSGMVAETEYDFRVRANNGTLNSQYTDIATATTFNTPPKAPVLSSPANASKVTDLTPLLSWTAATSGTPATSYRIQISTSSTFAVPTGFDYVDDGIGETFFAVESGLLENGTLYYWRVAAIDSHGQASSWSVKRSFSTPAISE
jgi:subtilisin family serine protease